MDISDINKVASRKRMNTDADKLREKVSRETAKIIKLKVAQDTAYWDLKEKLQQLEANHERLQQNMVEVQMQHEAISGQYQQELRLRPDTLNKLSGTRDICDVLEEYGERLRRGVARCRADQRALGAAYGACGDSVRRVAADAHRAHSAARAQRAATQRAERRHHDDQRRLALALERLGAESARADALEAARRDLAERLRAREEAAAALQADVARLTRDLDAHTSELKYTIAAREREAAAADAGERRAATLQAELRVAAEREAELRAERAEADAAIDRLKLEIATLIADKQDREAIIDDKNRRLTDLESEASRLKERVACAESDGLRLREQLNETMQQYEAQTSRVEELSRHTEALKVELGEARATHAADLNKIRMEMNEAQTTHATALNEARTKLSEVQATLAAQRAADAHRIEELSVAATQRDRELDDKTRTISRLMADLKAEATALGASRRQLEAERERHEAERASAQERFEAERSAAAAHRAELEAAARAKDDELNAQMGVILDIRSEKERLQERIGGMQATIDNIQKELTGREPRAPPPPPAERDNDDLLYSFLSADDDAPDAREVNRRFEALARGDMTRPQGLVSLSQVKKDLKMKNRTFFKNKRLESKWKKLKD